MKITEDKQNEIIGELLIKEKYKFIQNGLIGEIARDIFKELEKESK